MKTKTPGIVLIILGAIMMIYTGFNFVTTKNVVDIGAIKIDKEENHQCNGHQYLGQCFWLVGLY